MVNTICGNLYNNIGFYNIICLYKILNNVLNGGYVSTYKVYHERKSILTLFQCFNEGIQGTGNFLQHRLSYSATMVIWHSMMHALDLDQ